MAKSNKNTSGYGFNNWLGWGLTTLALFFLNKKHSSSSSSSEPADLNITSSKLGGVIPVVIGTCMVKSPLISYWGDFRADIYTEEYGMHSSLNVWPMLVQIILSILPLISKPAVVTTTDPAPAGPYVHSHPLSKVQTAEIENAKKRQTIVNVIVNFFIWLLMWLFNKHAGRTTIQKGFKYYLGYQQVICWANPNARLKKVYMNEKLAWEGDEPASNHVDGSYFDIRIDKPDLFGGVDENGGFVGNLHIYFGNDKQIGDPWMKEQMKAESVQEELRGYTPAYRPYISVVVPTAYVGKSATIPTTWFEIEIVPNKLDKLGGTEYAKIGDDVNPAEVLYDIVTNNDWGLAEKAESLDIDSLKKMSKKLADEKLGISVQLTSKEQARTVVDNICNHVNGIRYADPATGLMVHRLIRAEDTNEPMLAVNESNCSKITFVRQDWSNTVSEISVSFTDREALYETGTLSADDPANIEIQNGIKTTKSYDYSYFTTAANALWAARRCEYAQGYPLATVSLECNRMLSTVRLGDCLLLNFKPYGIKNMVIRVTNVDLSDFEDGTIKIDGMEDVFSLAKTAFEYSGSTEWERNPILPVGVQNWGVFELPYELTRIKDTYVNAYACQPSTGTTSWTIWRKRQEEGSDFQTTNTMSKWTAAGKLIYDYPEFGEVMDFNGFQVRELFGMEDLKFELGISSASDIEVTRQSSHIIIMGDEIMAYSGLQKLSNGNWSVTGVMRGIFDTVPHKHVSTDIVVFLQNGHYGNVTTGGPVCKAGETVDEWYNITTASVDEKEEFDSTRNIELITKRRAERPNVQGKIRMTAHMVSDKYNVDSLTGDLTITWAPRDKENSVSIVSQDDTTNYYTNEDIELPDGEEYITDVLVNGSVVYTKTDTTPAFGFTWADRCKASADLSAETTIDLYCKRNELESYQKQERTFMWNIPVLVGFCLTEQDALDTLANGLDVGGQIVLQKTDYNQPKYIDYINSPVFMLGKYANVTGNDNSATPSIILDGAIITNTGKYWIPNGKLLIFSDSSTYDVVEIKDCFTISTWFNQNNDNVERYLRWSDENQKFVEVNKNGQ
jgi:hypothetical protein